MKIYFFDKLRLVFSAYTVLTKLPSFKKMVSIFFRPFDAPRYYEFSYLQKFIKKHNLRNTYILDVSSPYMMAYILSKDNTVVKTDIDSSEKKFIQESKTLTFSIEDATRLSFEDDTFDFVYSVSVIEHIYEKYIEAIKEMIRVTKRHGYVYITFPVSKQFQEEWVDGNVYEKQHKKDGKTFFQYRFDDMHVRSIIAGIESCPVKILHKDIFWEQNDGAYDTLIKGVTRQIGNTYLTFIKNILINCWYGLTLFSGKPLHDFSHATACGNMHIIIQKT